MIIRLICRVLDTVAPLTWWLAPVALWMTAALVLMGVVR